MRNHLDESSVAQSLDRDRLTGSLRFPGSKLNAFPTGFQAVPHRLLRVGADQAVAQGRHFYAPMHIRRTESVRPAQLSGTSGLGLFPQAA